MHTPTRLPHHLAATGRATLARFRSGIEAIAFWMAVGSPLLYLPVFVSYQLDHAPIEAIGVLIGMNVLALVLGHRYNLSTRESVQPAVTSHAYTDTRTDDA